MSAKNKIHIVVGRTQSNKLEICYLGQDGDDALQKFDGLKNSKYAERLFFRSVRPTKQFKCEPLNEPKKSNSKDA